jgi:AcrR family transcriptional regulator
MVGRPIQNLYGQKIGPKGRRTRAAILIATRQLLEKRRLRELTVAEIAEKAEVGATTFYAYFPDVPTAALAVLAELDIVTPEIEEVFERPWAPEDAYQNAQDLLVAYCYTWDTNFALLHARNLAADDGDERFMKIRHDRALRLVQLLRKKIVQANPDADAASLSVVILTMMERLPVITRLTYSRRRSRKKLIEAAAFLIACAARGDCNPGLR